MFEVRLTEDELKELLDAAFDEDGDVRFSASLATKLKMPTEIVKRAQDQEIKSARHRLRKRTSEGLPMCNCHQVAASFIGKNAAWDCQIHGGMNMGKYIEDHLKQEFDGRTQQRQLEWKLEQLTDYSKVYKGGG